MEINAIILAAGKGTRMNSDLPKCAHKIIDKPMVKYVINVLQEVKIDQIVTVIGYGKEKIIEILGNDSQFVEQKEQLGTAHAVMQAAPILENKAGITIIAIGDMPFIRKETIYALLINHMKEAADLTVLTVDHPQPYGYGRIIRDSNDQVAAIVEERDCTKGQTLIKEINSSVYAIDNEKLFKYIKLINNHNDQNEYYLTDLVRVFNEKKLKVCAYKTNDYNELSGINTKSQLLEMEQKFQRKIIEKHIDNGVTIHNPLTNTIGKDVKIEPGCEIGPNVMLTGKTVIKKNSRIGFGTVIHNSFIDEDVSTELAYIKNSSIEKGMQIHPYTKIIKDI